MAKICDSNRDLLLSLFFEGIRLGLDLKRSRPDMESVRSEFEFGTTWTQVGTTHPQYNLYNGRQDSITTTSKIRHRPKINDLYRVHSRHRRVSSFFWDSIVLILFYFSNMQHCNCKVTPILINSIC